MTIKNLKLTLLKVIKREGNRKDTREHYLFYMGSFLDETGTVLNLKFSDDVVENKALWPRVQTMVTTPVEIDLTLFPKGFNLSGYVARVAVDKV